jgi:hypothetical protein
VAERRDSGKTVALMTSIYRCIAVLTVCFSCLLAESAAAAGGLGVTPSIMQTTARAGASGSVTIRNTSSRKLKVTVRARPWRQSRSGTVKAIRSRGLSGVRVIGGKFSLRPGTSRTIAVKLLRMPSRKSLYGALEVVGKPAKKHAGINVTYRLISSLRFNPKASARRLRLGAGSAAVKKRVLSLPVRNRGNTVDPVSGSYTLSGPAGARSGVIGAKPILPGKVVNLRLGSLAGLSKGRYAVTVRLLQAGRIRATVTRHFRLR